MSLPNVISLKNVVTRTESAAVSFIQEEILKKKAELFGIKLLPNVAEETKGAAGYCPGGVTLEQLRDIYQLFGITLLDWFTIRESSIQRHIKFHPTRSGTFTLGKCSIEEALAGEILSRLLRTAFDKKKCLFNFSSVNVPATLSRFIKQKRNGYSRFVCALPCSNLVCNRCGQIIPDMQSAIIFDRGVLHEHDNGKGGKQNKPAASIILFQTQI